MLRGITVGVVVAACVLAAILVTVGASSQGEAQAFGQCTDPPIRIESDTGPTGFVVEVPLIDEPVYRPGSGVSAGSGTAEDPYIIEEVCIRSDNTPGIEIEDTTDHLVIRNVEIGPPILSYQEILRSPGILLDDVANVRVEAVYIHEQTGDGLAVEGGEAIEVADSLFEDNQRRGALLEDTPEVAVSGNTMHGNGDLLDDGFELEIRDAPGAVLLGNALDGTRAFLTRTPSATVAQNTIRDAEPCVGVSNSEDVTVTTNTLTGCKNHIHLSQTNESLVSGNRLDGAGVTADKGIELEGARSNTVTANVVTGVGAAMQLKGPDNVVRANEVRGGDIAVWAPRNLVANNTVLLDHGHAISGRGGDDSSIVGNSLSGFNGLVIDRSDGLLVANNTVNVLNAGIVLEGNGATIEHNAFEITSPYTSGAAISLAVGTGTALTDNTMRGGSYAILVHDGGSVTAHGNTFAEHDEQGVRTLDDAGPVDATLNWWGCPEGPDGPESEGCVGAAGDVTVDPWLTSPNPDAGPV